MNLLYPYLMIVVGHDSITIGSKIRSKPRAHLREWSMSHLRGFLENNPDHYRFSNLIEVSIWLKDNELMIFDSSRPQFK